MKSGLRCVSTRRGCYDRASWFDGTLQLFASDIDDRVGRGDAIKSGGKRGVDGTRAVQPFEHGIREGERGGMEKKFAFKFQRDAGMYVEESGVSPPPLDGISRSRFETRLC